MTSSPMSWVDVSVQPKLPLKDPVLHVNVDVKSTVDNKMNKNAISPRKVRWGGQRHSGTQPRKQKYFSFNTILGDI